MHVGMRLQMHMTPGEMASELHSEVEHAMGIAGSGGNGSGGNGSGGDPGPLDGTGPEGAAPMPQQAQSNSSAPPE